MSSPIPFPGPGKPGVAWYCHGQWEFLKQAPSHLIILSGSFNPFHAGHRGLLQTAERRLNRRSICELSISNVDKSCIDSSEVRTRVSQFRDTEVAVTYAATFHEKSLLFPAATFVIGYDTASRLLNPAYYQNRAERMLQQLTDMQSRGVQFLVAGRINSSGEFTQLQFETIPADIRSMFTRVPETEFRCDVSSTAIRRQRNQQ